MTAALVESRPRAEAAPYRYTPLALGLAGFAICAFSPALFNDGDTFTHIATGDWIAAQWAIPRGDPFTWSVPGQAWTAHEWLSALALAAAYRLGGLIGAALLTGLALGFGLHVVARVAARRLGGPALAALGLFALLLIAPGLLARPHILALPVFTLWAEALVEGEGRSPPLRYAALMTLWANLHGGFAFGLALLAPFALEGLLAAAPVERLARARQWAIFGLAALAAAAVTPYGVEGLLFPVRLMGLHALSRIGEWGPETFAHPNALEAALLGLIALGAALPFRLPPVRLALLLGLLHLALAHARHELLLAVLAPMLIAGPLAHALGVQAEPNPGRRALAGLAVAALALGLARFALPAPVVPGLASAEAALAALPAEAAARPCLNGYPFGGYLIFHGVKPYVDGRADMFGDAFLDRYARIARGEPDALDPALAEKRVGWTMFAPEQGAVAAMDRKRDWRRVYADSRVIVHVRAAP